METSTITHSFHNVICDAKTSKSTCSNPTRQTKHYILESRCDHDLLPKVFPSYSIANIESKCGLKPNNDHFLVMKNPYFKAIGEMN
jgi:hypothetical protein